MNNSNNKLSIFKFEHENGFSTFAHKRSVIAYNIEQVIQGKMYTPYDVRHPLISQTVKDNYNMKQYMPSYSDGPNTRRKNINEFNYSDLILEFDKVIELISQSRYSEQIKIRPLKDLLEQIMINWDE